MEKRGLGHIEIVLSFILFIAAVFVIFYFFNPGKTTTIANPSLQQAMKGISENLSVDLAKYSLKLNGGAIGIESIIGILIKNASQNSKVRAQSYSGERLNASSQQVPGSSDRIVYLQWAGEEFVYLLFSDDFNENLPIQNINPNPDYYKIGSFNSERILSEKRLFGLNESYYSNYAGVKNSLKLPASVDFGFIFSFFDGRTITARREAPAQQEVFSLSDKGEIIKTDGATGYGELIVQIW